MPLAQPIAALRQELNKLLADDDLPAGLKLCKELLPENGEKFKLILALQAQLQQLNKDNIKGKITQEEYARRLAIIVDAFITFVSELETVDFDPPAVDLDPDVQGVQTGQVLYRVPHSMALGKASICTIRVAIDEDAILEDIIIDKDTRLKEKIEVSERMNAELVDIENQAFNILSLNAKDQLIQPTGYTQWLFRVTPLLEGEHQLLVKVSILEFDPNTKEYVPRDVSVLETVMVTSARQHSDEEELPLKPMGESIVVGNPKAAMETTGGLDLEDFKDILLPNVKSTEKKETKPASKPSPGPPTRSEPSDPFYKGMALVRGGGLRKNSLFSIDNAKPEKKLPNSTKPIDFYFMKSPVTHAQWRTVMGSNAAGFDGCDECMVENASREDIQAFLKMLNAQTGRQYRLPTEAEWKLAAKAGFRKGLGIWLVL